MYSNLGWLPRNGLNVVAKPSGTVEVLTARGKLIRTYTWHEWEETYRERFMLSADPTHSNAGWRQKPGYKVNESSGGVVVRETRRGRFVAAFEWADWVQTGRATYMKPAA